MGRYLTNSPVTGAIDKNIKPSELSTIFYSGLKVVPIFQEGGSSLNYFSYYQGKQAAYRAHAAATSYGFHDGTVIYFAVDFDAYKSEVLGSVHPSFPRNQRGARGNLESLQRRHLRRPIHVPARAARARHLSFISDMSTAYSGNLWALCRATGHSTESSSTPSGRARRDRNRQERLIGLRRRAGERSVANDVPGVRVLARRPGRRVPHAEPLGDDQPHSTVSSVSAARSVSRPGVVLARWTIDSASISFVDAVLTTPSHGLISPGSGRTSTETTCGIHARIRPPCTLMDRDGSLYQLR